MFSIYFGSHVKHVTLAPQPAQEILLFVEVTRIISRLFRAKYFESHVFYGISTPERRR